MAVTPTATYPISGTTFTTTGAKTMVSASFTPLANEYLVVKVGTNATGTAITSVTGGGLTWNKVSSIATANSAPGAIFVATVGATSPGAMTVTVNLNITTTGGAAAALVERWPAGCALGVVGTAVSLNSTCSTSITPATAGSAISGFVADYNAVGSGTGTAPTRTYRGSGTVEENYFRTSSAGLLVTEAIYVPTVGANAAQTWGMSAPTGQAATMLAIEIKPPPPSYTGAVIALVASTASTLAANNKTISVAKPAGSVADAEPSAFTFTGSSTSSNRVTIMRFSGVDPSTPILTAPVMAGDSATAATAHVAPSVAWAPGAALVELFANYGGSGAYTAPGTSTVAGIAPNATGTMHETAVEIAPTSTAATGASTGTRTATYSKSVRWVAAALAIDPASTPSAGVELLLAAHTIDSDGIASQMAGPPGWTPLGPAVASANSICHTRFYYKFVTPAFTWRRNAHPDPAGIRGPYKPPNAPAMRYDGSTGSNMAPNMSVTGFPRSTGYRATGTIDYQDTFYAFIPAVPGQQITYSAYLRVEGATATGFVAISAYDVNGNFISSNATSGYSYTLAPSTTTATRFSDTYTMPANTAFAGAYISIRTAGTITVREASCFQIDIGVAAPYAYADGDTAGWAWEGATKMSPASTSSAAFWAMDSGPSSVALTNVAAGFQDEPSQREAYIPANTPPETFNDNSTPWPLPMVAAPGGRPGKASLVWLPDYYYRVEQMPNHYDFGDGDGPYFFGQSFYLGADWPLDVDPGTAFQTIEQMRQLDTGGSPPFEFECSGGALRLTGGYGMTGAPTVNAWVINQVLVPTIERQRWYSLVYRVSKFSATAGQSILDVWVDGWQVLVGFTVPGPTVVGGRTYRKMGCYHSYSLTAASIYQAGVAFGTSYAAANPYLAPNLTPKPPPVPVFF